MEGLGINSGLLLAQLINFIIVLVVYIKFVHKPFLKKLSEEHKKRKELNSLVEKAQENEARLEKERLQMERELEARLKKEYARMKKEVEKAKHAIIQEAHEEAARVREHNAKLISQEKEKMFEEVRKESIVLATVLLKKALEGIVDKKMQESVTKRVVSKLPELQNGQAN